MIFKKKQGTIDEVEIRLQEENDSCGSYYYKRKWSEAACKSGRCGVDVWLVDQLEGVWLSLFLRANTIFKELIRYDSSRSYKLSKDLDKWAFNS